MMRVLSFMVALVSFTAANDQETLVDPKEADCMNWNAYWYASDDTYCNSVWEEWDKYCMYYGVPGNCMAIEEEMNTVPM